MAIREEGGDLKLELDLYYSVIDLIKYIYDNDQDNIVIVQT